MAYPLWIWKRLTTTSLRKKTRQTLRFDCMVPAKGQRPGLIPAQVEGLGNPVKIHPRANAPLHFSVELFYFFYWPD